MDFEIVKIEELSGAKATFYTIVIDEYKNLFEEFLQENISYKKELQDIIRTIQLMANKKGVADFLIKNHEGGIGDGIIALFDTPDKNLRLYAIKFGNQILILGGGGFKSKNIRAWQEDKNLSDKMNMLKMISRKINERIREKEIEFDEDYLELVGNLKFEEDEQ